MSDELKFYTNPQSRGRIVRWMLEEIGAPYQTEVLEYGTTMKAPEYLAINPMGKVPAIVHGDKVVTECAAICAYLADAFPEANLAPAPRDRASYYRWMFFAAGPVEAAVANRSMEIVVPEKKRGMVGYGSFELTRSTLIEAVTANAYVAGDQFSAADVYVGSQIGFGLQFGTIESCPQLEEYWGRISDRAAYKRACDIDDALLAEA